MLSIPCFHRAVAAITIGGTAGVVFTGVAGTVVVADAGTVCGTIDTVFPKT